MIRFERRAVRCFYDRHRRPSGQNLAQHALAFCGKMQNHNKCHAAVGRQVIEKRMERIDATGGRTNADDGKLGRSHRAFTLMSYIAGTASPSLWFSNVALAQGYLCRMSPTGWERLPKAKLRFRWDLRRFGTPMTTSGWECCGTGGSTAFRIRRP
jgi:hypothetical protein